MELTILSALIPAGLDMLKQAGGAISRKWFGLSVDDEIKLKSADIERLKAVAQLDNPHGTPSQWIVDMRAAFRYVSAGISILAGIYFMANAQPELGLELVSVPFGFIFGERLWMGLKGPNSK